MRSVRTSRGRAPWCLPAAGRFLGLIVSGLEHHLLGGFHYRSYYEGDHVSYVVSRV